MRYFLWQDAVLRELPNGMAEDITNGYLVEKHYMPYHITDSFKEIPESMINEPIEIIRLYLAL